MGNNEVETVDCFTVHEMLVGLARVEADEDTPVIPCMEIYDNEGNRMVFATPFITMEHSDDGVFFGFECHINDLVEFLGEFIDVEED